MRAINRIILHCTATPEGREFGADDIDRWHKRRGWRGIGYHYVIRLDGTIEEGRPVEQIGAHVRGYNADSIGVVYVGGLAADGRTAKDTRTPAQHSALLLLVARLCREHGVLTEHVYGHREYAAKACPSFDPQQFRRELMQYDEIAQPAQDMRVDELPMLDLRGTDAERAAVTMQQNLGVASDAIIGPDTWGAILEQLGSPECGH